MEADERSSDRRAQKSASSPGATKTLLNVDLHGGAKPVLQEPEKDLGWAIPSSDGRHLAIWAASSSSNAWLLEADKNNLGAVGRNDAALGGVHEFAGRATENGDAP